MHDLDDVFAAFGTIAEMAANLDGVPYQTVAAWKQRRSIPAKYFSRIAAAAQKRGADFVTLEFLLSLKADTALSMTGDDDEDEGPAQTIEEAARRAVKKKNAHRGKP